MHNEILDPKQTELLPLVTDFGDAFYLVGGTALALQIGHRRSVDFDLFSKTGFDNQKIRNQLRRDHRIDRTFIDQEGELTISINSVKLTFFYYPYPVVHPVSFSGNLTMPDEITIAAMKAFALGRRAKWKDYVDLYFIFRQYSLGSVLGRAKEIFSQEFDEKLFRGQLAYHQDINYSETVDFMPGREISREEILNSLVKTSLS